MTCKNCVKLQDCENLSTHNFDHAHQMWMIEFWENAEQRCKDFQDNGTDNVIGGASNGNE